LVESFHGLADLLMVCRQVFVESQPFIQGIGKDSDLIGSLYLAVKEIESRSFGLFETLGIVEEKVKEEEKPPAEPGRTKGRGGGRLLPLLFRSEQVVRLKLGYGYGLAVVVQPEIFNPQIRDRISLSVRDIDLDEFERDCNLMLRYSFFLKGPCRLPGTQENTCKKTPRSKYPPDVLSHPFIIKQSALLSTWRLLVPAGQTLSSPALIHPSLADPGPELFVKVEARRTLLQIILEAEGLPVLRREPGFVGSVVKGPGLRMELDAQDMAIALVLDRLDDFSIER
jgi:hypothetical protein